MQSGMQCPRYIANKQVLEPVGVRPYSDVIVELYYVP